MLANSPEGEREFEEECNTIVVLEGVVINRKNGTFCLSNFLCKKRTTTDTFQIYLPSLELWYIWLLSHLDISEVLNFDVFRRPSSQIYSTLTWYIED